LTELLTIVTGLRRPSLLIRAARLGMTEYNRSRDLRRLTRMTDAPAPDAALRVLIAEEERLEDIRRAGDASYSLGRHIELLIAMMAEIRLLPRPATEV
jgi:hypothetical protein